MPCYSRLSTAQPFKKKEKMSKINTSIDALIKKWRDFGCLREVCAHWSWLSDQGSHAEALLHRKLAGMHALRAVSGTPVAAGMPHAPQFCFDIDLEQSFAPVKPPDAALLLRTSPDGGAMTTKASLRLVLSYSRPDQVPAMYERKSVYGRIEYEIDPTAAALELGSTISALSTLCRLSLRLQQCVCIAHAALPEASFEQAYDTWSAIQAEITSAVAHILNAQPDSPWGDASRRAPLETRIDIWRAACRTRTDDIKASLFAKMRPQSAGGGADRSRRLLDRELGLHAQIVASSQSRSPPCSIVTPERSRDHRRLYAIKSYMFETNWIASLYVLPDKDHEGTGWHDELGLRILPSQATAGLAVISYALSATATQPIHPVALFTLDMFPHANQDLAISAFQSLPSAEHKRAVFCMAFEHARHKILLDHDIAPAKLASIMYTLLEHLTSPAWDKEVAALDHVIETQTEK